MSGRFDDDLICPLSGDDLERTNTGGVEELVCVGCDKRWPIVDSVPRLVPPDLADELRETAEAFGWEWQQFSEMHPEFEAQFLDWISPITPGFFEGKRVLDAGCGTGRHAFFAASWGASEVVAIDLSPAVETARSNLSQFTNVRIIQADMLRLPLRTAAEGGGFDLIYSIGVLHHLPSPRHGFESLLKHLRPGGTIAVWVYGYEGNAIVRHAVEPLRRVTRRMPPQTLHRITWPLAGAFHVGAKWVYRPLSGTPVGRRLPMNKYLASVATFSFRQNHGIVFDQLVAPTTAYIKRSELEQWFVEGGLEEVRITGRHGNSWRGQGRLPLE